ncbi:hypothetical protein SAMN05216573_12028 [Bradyrhizobium sp. Rc3b]|nr:hypothetical protein SAMN05216573_12028 [Bradyrhizobium sp. Rc3b]
MIMTCVAMGYPDDDLPRTPFARTASITKSSCATWVLPISIMKRRLFSRKIFLVRSRSRPLAISKMREEQYAD